MNMHVKASRFKVGDRVKLRDGEYMNAKAGATATVTGHEEPYVVIKWDRNDLSGSQMNGKYYPKSFELAPRFTVGDKVRLTKDNSGYGNKDDTGSILHVGSDDCFVRLDVKRSGMTDWYVPHSGIEPAPTYTSCAAAEVDNLAAEYGCGKVAGPREPGYRFTTKNRPQPGDRVSIGDNGTFTVKDVKDNGAVSFTDRPRALTWLLHSNASTSACTLVQPATLTIQAGRCYKTRDGRMVGPMEKSSIDAWTGDGGRRLYRNDGQRYFACDRGGDDDLIAEWSDTSDDVPLRGVSPVVAPATTAKFKVGDKVGCTTNRGTNYIIKRVDGDKVDVAYVTDAGVEGSYTYQGHPQDIFFHLPQTPTTMADIVRKHSGTAIVCLIESGQPKPSTLPFVHLNEDAAATEASRLAGIHKGQEFGVYTCVDVRKVERVYEHEWQRLAARGSKIPAIKALIDASGINLVAARDAVNEWLRREAA